MEKNPLDEVRLINANALKKALYAEVNFKMKWTMENMWVFSLDEIERIIDKVPTYDR